MLCSSVLGGPTVAMPGGPGPRMVGQNTMNPMNPNMPDLAGPRGPMMRKYPVSKTVN